MLSHGLSQLLEICRDGDQRKQQFPSWDSLCLKAKAGLRAEREGRAKGAVHQNEGEEESRRSASNHHLKGKRRGDRSLRGREGGEGADLYGHALDHVGSVHFM